VSSVLEFSGRLSVEVVVVDNCSDDNSLEKIQELSSVKVIVNDSNLGFSRACNIGAFNATGSFLLFLNPDALVFEGTLDTVFSFMTDPSNARVGICGTQLLNEVGKIERSCSRYPSLSNIFSQAIGFNKIFPTTGMSMVDWDHKTSAYVDQVIGAFFFTSSDLFKRLGGFDERFFVYFEEVDFAFRASKLGMLSYYLSSTQAFHAGGGVSRQVKAKRLFYSWRSRIQFFSKHYSMLKTLVVAFITIVVEPLVRSLFFLARFDFVSVKETWAAWRMLAKWLLSN
jgi:hypothetical protein